jgi:hypothetical protein
MVLVDNAMGSPGFVGSFVRSVDSKTSGIDSSELCSRPTPILFHILLCLNIGPCLLLTVLKKSDVRNVI